MILAGLAQVKRNRIANASQSRYRVARNHRARGAADMGDSLQSNNQDQSAAQASASGPEEVESKVLLGCCGELHIRHQGQVYCLRRTGKGGLILTK